MNQIVTCDWINCVGGLFTCKKFVLMSAGDGFSCTDHCGVCFFFLGGGGDRLGVSEQLINTPCYC